ncbi:MAG: protein translocase subunit SecD [Phycisphaerales bacterium]
MRHLLRNTFITIFVILWAIYMIVPPADTLRRGKDLAGGVSLTYQVEIGQGDTGDTLGTVVELLKQRVDPNGVLDIEMNPIGGNRIEITMPLASPELVQRRQEFEAKLEALVAGSVKPEQLDEMMSRPAADRQRNLDSLAAGNAERSALLARAAAAFDAKTAAQAEFRDRRSALEQSFEQATEALRLALVANQGEEALKPLRDAVTAANDAIIDASRKAALASIDYEKVRGEVVAKSITGPEIRRVLELPTRRPKLVDASGKRMEGKSPRDRGIERLLAAHPAVEKELLALVGDWDQYQSQRRTLDDPGDLKRILRGAGVLNFRIGVRPGDLTEEASLREQLRQRGPRAVRFDQARWFRLHKEEGWYEDGDDASYRNLRENTAAHFAQRYQLVAEQYDGQIYMLLWDVPGKRLTQSEGSWSVERAFPQPDQLGRPGIGFQMNGPGSVLMGNLTGQNIRGAMAVLLDDQVYTAPTVQSAISSRGEITGSFTQAEVSNIVRTLNAGAMAAKLSPEPISETTIGPELGLDNLQRGLIATGVAFVAVAVFMVVYYFFGGLIAVVALIANGLLILALMSLNKAAFTLPGIAGIVLTFGMAVDANVLIFERLREEILRGNDLRTAVRLAYSKALSAIIDGNITNLIVCVVLAFTGTQEIRGFAITMSIGVVTTLFAQLFITRVIYTFFVEKLHFRNLGNMLPLALPGLQRAITPNFDWMKFRFVAYAFSIILTLSLLGLISYQGRDMLDTEFRGGTRITLDLRNPDTKQPLTMTRAEVQEKVTSLADGPLSELKQATVLAVNPEADQVTSSTFTIKTTITDTETLSAALSRAFAGKLIQEQSLTFKGSDATTGRAAPIRPILSRTLGESIDRPGIRTDVRDFEGGLAVVLEDIGPTPPPLDQIRDRLLRMRSEPQFLATANTRAFRVELLDGTPEAARSVAILVADPIADYRTDQLRWQGELRDQEWKITREALLRASTLPGVEKFDASVARTFTAQAIIAVVISVLLVVIYVWVRFASFRYSAACIVSTLHDCIVAVGFIAVAEVFFAAAPTTASAMGILPFKIDLNVIAAVLTILGSSLNDTIVILDRIRENRGKLPGATRQIINTSINQTFSRTLMTGGSVIAATFVLYFLGGEALRSFSYCFIVGVLTGTYSSVAIGAPLVWSRNLDPTINPETSSPLQSRGLSTT